ncbi:MAG: chemotaxis protein CheA [Elusimicrobia bacterium]|nr:chemotaxis protein CheA [Elusimicrobiota bacterium]
MSAEEYSRTPEMQELFLSESGEILRQLDKALVQLEKAPDPKLLNEIFRASHSLKGMAGTMGYERTSHLAHAMEDLLARLREGTAKVSPEVVDLLLECRDALQALVDAIASAGDDTGVDNGPILAKVQAALAGPASSPPLAGAAPAARGEAAAPSKITSIRLNIEHLDALMNLVGELVLNKARLLNIAARREVPDLREALKEFERISHSLQDRVLKTRMVPIALLLDTYPRMVRDLARDKGKPVDFAVAGQDIEADRILLEELNQPLVHILRNVVDHGIESAEERRRAGKPAAGRVSLAARQEKGQLRITVTDDGRGMSPERIKRKAVDKGFLTEAEAESLSREEAFMLICKPGFSTAEKLSETSGRGVGMDAVKALVDKHNGRLRIESTEGQGTSMSISLPLSLAIIRTLLVRSGPDVYVIPLRNVRELVGIGRHNLRTIEGRRAIILRDEVIPLFALEELYFGKAAGAAAGPYAVVLDHERRIALQVDALVGQQEVVIKTLTGLMRKVRGFSGATILGDGRAALIVDIEELL